jgi:hypothetical protein
MPLPPSTKGFWHLQLNSTIRTVALTLLLAALLIGVIHLFMLRFQDGDIYPAYSSLRSDPLGAKALYESLAHFDHITLQRNYHKLSSLKFEHDTTLFYLGVPAAEDDLITQALSEAFDRLTHSGGRLVLTFMPVNKKAGRQPGEGPDAAGECKNDGPAENDSEDQKPACGEPSETPSSDPGEIKDRTGERESRQKQWVSLKHYWGVGFALNEDLAVKDDKFLAVDAVSRRRNLTEAVSWHTNLFFQLFDDGWQTLYTVAGNPVVVERAMAGGTIVLCADSFFISNEALRSERHPQLLVWLLGPHSNIMFDESHFGIYRHPGVAGLMRHYRFHGVLAALVAVALLFVWNRAVHFVPPRTDEMPTGVDIVSAKNDRRGLVALLRRNIAGPKILQVCGQEWERTFRKDKRIQPGAFERVRTILQADSQTSPKKADPVKGYRNISRTISEDKGYE